MKDNTSKRPNYKPLIIAVIVAFLLIAAIIAVFKSGQQQPVKRAPKDIAAYRLVTQPQMVEDTNVTTAELDCSYGDHCTFGNYTVTVQPVTGAASFRSLYDQTVSQISNGKLPNRAIEKLPASEDLFGKLPDDLPIQAASDFYDTSGGTDKLLTTTVLFSNGEIVDFSFPDDSTPSVDRKLVKDASLNFFKALTFKKV